MSYKMDHTDIFATLTTSSEDPNVDQEESNHYENIEMCETLPSNADGTTERNLFRTEERDHLEMKETPLSVEADVREENIVQTLNDTHLELKEPPLTANGTRDENSIDAIIAVCEENQFQSNQCDSMSSVWTYKHIVATCVAALGMISIGAGTQGYVTTAIPDLNTHNNPFHMSTDETLVFITMNSIAATISCLLVSWCMDRFGRKLSMMVGCVLITFGLVIISAASNIYMMHGGQFVAGLGAGISQPTIIVYVAEIAPISIRGSLMTCIETSYNVGLLFAFTIGVFINWRWQAIACACISFVNICTLLILPDSPRWLYMVGRQEDGLESTRWFYKDDSDISPITSEGEENQTERKVVTPWKSFLKLPLIKLVIVSQILFITREFVGMNVLRKFAVVIFETAGSTLNPHIETVIFGIASLSGAILCIILVDRFPRRCLIMISCAILAITLATIGTYFKLEDLRYTDITQHLSWLPLLSIIFAAIGYNIGIATLTYALSAELFPTTSRGKANAVSIIGYNVWMTTSNWAFGNLLTGVHSSIAFFTFSAFGLFGIIFVYFAIPETKSQAIH